MNLLPGSALALQSPFLEAAYGDENSVRLEDVTGEWALLHVQGQGALDTLSRLFGDGPLAPGAVWRSSSGLVVALRRDVGLVLAPPANAQAAGARLAAAAQEQLTIVDMTHGRGLMALSTSPGQAGTTAEAVLSQLCGLDFSGRAFPNGRAAQTSLAKVRALIVRDDVHAARRYLLAVDRSHAAYVWDAIIDAMQEFLAG